MGKEQVNWKEMSGAVDRRGKLCKKKMTANGYWKLWDAANTIIVYPQHFLLYEENILYIDIDVV